MHFINYAADLIITCSSCCLLSSPSEGDSPSEESMKQLLAAVRDQLLQGLTDDAESIR